MYCHATIQQETKAPISSSETVQGRIKGAIRLFTGGQYNRPALFLTRLFWEITLAGSKTKFPVERARLMRPIDLIVSGYFDYPSGDLVPIQCLIDRIANVTIVKV